MAVTLPNVPLTGTIVSTELDDNFSTLANKFGSITNADVLAAIIRRLSPTIDCYRSDFSPCIASRRQRNLSRSSRLGLCCYGPSTNTGQLRCRFLGRQVPQSLSTGFRAGTSGSNNAMDFSYLVGRTSIHLRSNNWP